MSLYSLATHIDIQFGTFTTYGNLDTLFVTFATQMVYLLPCLTFDTNIDIYISEKNITH